MNESVSQLAGGIVEHDQHGGMDVTTLVESSAVQTSKKYIHAYVMTDYVVSPSMPHEDSEAEESGDVRLDVDYVNVYERVLVMWGAPQGRRSEAML